MLMGLVVPTAAEPRKLQSPPATTTALVCQGLLPIGHSEGRGIPKDRGGGPRGSGRWGPQESHGGGGETPAQQGLFPAVAPSPPSTAPGTQQMISKCL